jgi:hypothetical protein
VTRTPRPSTLVRFSQAHHDRLGFRRSKVFRYFFELANRIARRSTTRPDRILETVIDVIVDQRLLGVGDRLFDRVQLLCEIHALTPLLNHLNNRPEMTVRSLEAIHDF